MRFYELCIPRVGCFPDRKASYTLDSYPDVSRRSELRVRRRYCNGKLGCSLARPAIQRDDLIASVRRNHEYNAFVAAPRGPSCMIHPRPIHFETLRPPIKAEPRQCQTHPLAWDAIANRSAQSRTTTTLLMRSLSVRTCPIFVQPKVVHPILLDGNAGPTW